MEGTTDMEEKSNSKLPAGERDDVNSEVVPSVDSDKNSLDWNLTAKTSKLRETVQKRKRPRRKSKKRKYPYARTSWQQRREMRNSERDQSVRQQMFANNGQPVAPYNTTQFLIEDHGDLENIDAQLQKEQTLMPGGRPPRARDSSFSVDSDEDYFYSSPEDEGEFLTKEFSNTYEDLHLERLSSMSKAEIIHDYLQLEAKYEKAVIELRRLKRGGRDDEGEGSIPEIQKDQDRDTDTSSKSENELAEQLRISQLENKSLKVELEELQKENKTLHNLIEKNQSSSVDSESDSSSTSSRSNDSSSCDSDSDDEMNSTNNNTNNNNNRTQGLNQSDSIMENNTVTNYSTLNGVNGNLSLSEDEGSGEDRQEPDK